MADGWTDYASYLQNDQIRQAANDNATQAYNRSKLAGEAEDRALAAAKFEWQKVMDRAGLTGRFEDQWTFPSAQWFTQQFGTWMPQGPSPGQQTMAREQQTYEQQQGYGQMYGSYFAPGTAPTQGQQTLSAQDLAMRNAATAAGLTGYYVAPGTTGQGTQTLAGQQQQFMQGLQTQQEQRAAQQQQQAQAMGYLNLLSNLRGPADWAKYQQVLGSTPGGMRDLVAAAMGQYVPGGGATTGYQPQAASLQSMMGQVAGTPYYGQGGGQLNMPNVYQGGQGSYGQQPQQAQAMYYNPAQAQAAPQAQEQMQSAWEAQPGAAQARQQWAAQQMPQQTWGTGIGVGAQQPTPTQQQQGLGGGTNLPAPNQISAQSWNNMAPSQREMLLGMYESQGWHKPDVEALMNQALPRYSSNAPSAGTWRM